MKTKYLLLLPLAFGGTACRAAEPARVSATLPPEIEDEGVMGINKQPWHATLMPYANMAEALKANRYQSSFAQSLNGQWKFNWVPRPEVRPVDFYKPDFNDSGWKTIAVPSNWQMQGYDTPVYRNNGYTFKSDWPHVMSEPPKDYSNFKDRNPVGSYRRSFTVPANWSGRRIFLSFDGVDAGFYLWINGQKVGYSVNSRNVAEFDITPYLKSGTNLLATEVYRYCAGSYLEDQDMWRLSGIFRNVTLWSAPEVHMRDFKITTDLDANYRNATLAASAKVRNYSDQPTAARTFAVSLYDPSGKAMTGVRAQVAVPALGAGEEREVSVSIPVANPAKWTAETPTLYTAVLSLAGKGSPELLSQRVGFRKIEIKGRLFCLNGVPIKLKGVNRHENEPDTGHYVSEARMMQDIVRLKEANCNHVRTSHYTDDPRWYELCDQYGLYLVAEANIECHGLYNVLDRQPRWEKAFLDRNTANVENLKNHPSIIIWSMGNECGGGSNMRAAEKLVRSLDPTRPTHYEAFGIGDNNPASLDSQMYTGVADVERNAQNNTLTKPYYMCEYAHAMFNSMGGLGEYNDVFDKYPSILGGAIWEWEDQGLWNRRDPKRQYIAYGGGFGDVPNDHYFIHKGVVFSDRTPKPHFPEVKRVYQWIGFAPADLSRNQIKIKNKYAFIDLSGFKGSWVVLEDGVKVQSGNLPTLKLGPQQETTLTLPIKAIQPKPGAKYLLNVSMALAKDASWQKAGYVVAGGQMELPVATAPPVLNAAGMKAVTVSDDSSPTITVKGDGFEVAFNKANGQITRLSRDGVNVILPNGGPKLQLWRATHHMDDEWASGAWHSNGLDALTTKTLSIAAHQVSSSLVRVDASVLYEGKNGFSATHAVSYNVYGDGSIVVDNAVMPQGPKNELARIGVQLLLDKRLSNLDYLARGPMENYSDRKRGSDIGHYTSTVAQQMTPYSKPMENGNHEDTSWLALRGGGVPTLLAKAEGMPLQFSAQPYSDEQMEAPEYTVDLPPSNATVLTLAGKTLGVGEAGHGPLPQYRLKPDAMSFSYGLRLLAPEAKDVAKTARVVAESGRIRPVLAERDKMGLISLEGSSVEYSTDGSKWQTYSTPFAFAQGGLLKVRSNKGGQSIEGIIPFEAFVDRTNWKATASTFEPNHGEPSHAIDGDPGTFWHTQYTPNRIPAPHYLLVDMGKSLTVQAVKLTQRSDAFANGRAKEYELYASEDGTFDKPVLMGTLPSEGSTQTLKLPAPVKARYWKYVVLHDQPGYDFGSLAEFNVVPAGE